MEGLSTTVGGGTSEPRKFSENFRSSPRFPRSVMAAASSLAAGSEAVGESSADSVSSTDVSRAAATASEADSGFSAALSSLALTASGPVNLPPAAAEAAVGPSAADLLESVREQCTCPITLVRAKGYVMFPAGLCCCCKMGVS